MRYCKAISSLLLWVLWECLIMPISNDSITVYKTLMFKVLKLSCGKSWCLSTCKKSTSSLTSFLRYCEDNANLLFWELWESSTIPIKNHSINLWETFMLICMQQINFITHFFLKILQRNSKLVILGNSGMSRHT